MTALSVDRDLLVETASRMIGVHSFTGDEEGMARLMVELYEEMSLQVQWQQVEDGRANALGTWAGAGGGKSLMFNGHMDTSYSGREPWLRDVPGFQPHAFVRDGRLYGLGVSNMKGALACYVEAVRALQDAGLRLRGDVLIAAVCGEIEKTQQGDAQGAEYRGYAAGSRYLGSHGGVARREVLELVRSLAERFPDYGVEGEVYVTAPGSEIDEGHELVAAIDASHAEVFGEPPGRDVTRWFSDASVLTRYGIPTVNYGTSTGRMAVAR